MNMCLAKANSFEINAGTCSEKESSVVKATRAIKLKRKQVVYLLVNGIPQSILLNTANNNVRTIKIDKYVTRVHGVINNVPLDLVCNCSKNRLDALIDTAMTAGSSLQEVLNAFEVGYFNTRH